VPSTWRQPDPAGPGTFCFDGSCLNNLGIWGFDPKLGTHTRIGSLKNTSLFFDTAAMAQNGDVTLTWTYSLQAANNWLAISLSLSFFTPVRFAFEQNRDYSKPYQFRPRDARDGAIADCADFPDDCYPSFDLFTLFQNPAADGPPLDITATFKLTLPAFRTGWLHGTSTNYGSDTDANDNDLPDYIFEASQNPTLPAPSADGLTITTPPITGRHVPIVVTSHDYGGSANIQANIVVHYNGATYTYPVPTAAPDTDQTNWTPPPCAGNGWFIPLPLDTDCNNLPDWWEGQYTSPKGGHLDPTADNEPGYAPDSPKGDGWSVHNEYRGFHYIPDDSSTPKWTSTDPVNKFDIFFWGAGFQAPNRPFGSGLPDDLPTDASVYPKALRRILCRQGTYDEMGATTQFGPTYPNGQTIGVPNVPPPVAENSMRGYNYCSGGINEYDPTQGPGSPVNPLKFWYRRVSATQANARSQADPAAVAQGVNFFNKNSLTTPQGNHTVVVYFYQPHSRSANQTRLDLAATTNNLSPCPDCTDPHLARIAFDFDAIARQAQSDAHRGATTMPAMTLAAEVIAHETGHWFQQNHAARPGCCTFVSGGQPSGLNWTTYTTDSQKNVLVGIEAYPNNSRQLTPVDQLECGFSPGPQESPIRIVKNLPGAPDMRVYTLGAPQLDPSVQGVIVDYLQYELMDWTPNMSLADRTQWHFDPSNLKALCAMNPCPVPGKTLCHF
jgi:hypothetical protein